MAKWGCAKILESGLKWRIFVQLHLLLTDLQVSKGLPLAFTLICWNVGRRCSRGCCEVQAPFGFSRRFDAGGLGIY